MKYNPYSKVVNLKKEYALCAIFEPHPFRCSAISDAVKQSVNTGIKDNEWCYYVDNYIPTTTYFCSSFACFSGSAIKVLFEQFLKSSYLSL